MLGHSRVKSAAAGIGRVLADILTGVLGFVVRAVEPAVKVVYAVCADADAGAAIEGKGFAGFVVKPVKVEQIRDILIKLRKGAEV